MNPQQEQVFARRREVARGLIVDAAFLGGLGLFGWGVWRSFPQYAPLVLGLTLMAIAGGLHILNSRGSDAA